MSFMGVTGLDAQCLPFGVAFGVRTCTVGSLSENLDGVLMEMSCLRTAGLA